MRLSNKYSAFTLLELLLAMLIFSIIAVMLVPNITQDAEKELFATQVKKVQNDIQQAMLLIMAKNRNSLIGFCAGAGGANACFIKNGIAAHLEKKIIFNDSFCSGDGSGTEEGVACKGYSKREQIFLNGNSATLPVNNPNTGFEAIRLKNGSTISVIFNSACNFADNVVGAQLPAGVNGCGYMEIDVNSEKSPNTVGKDIHYFWIIDKDGLVPFGEIDDGATCGNCNDSGVCAKASYPGADNTNSHNIGCTARVLNRGKIDYY